MEVVCALRVARLAGDVIDGGVLIPARRKELECRVHEFGAGELALFESVDGCPGHSRSEYRL